jgi:hypothetical protein
MEDYLAS